MLLFIPQRLLVIGPFRVFLNKGVSGRWGNAGGDCEPGAEFRGGGDRRGRVGEGRAIFSFEPGFRASAHPWGVVHADPLLVCIHILFAFSLRRISFHIQVMNEY